MKKSILYLSVLLIVASCGNEIKNDENKVIVESGTEVSDNTQTATKPVAKIISSEITTQDTTELIVKELPQTPLEQSEATEYMLGFWVGYFMNDDEEVNEMYFDEGLWWDRGNKINISIDQILDTIVKGHSVVAGNDRPFEGLLTQTDNGYSFFVTEPGDDKYDGEFTFVIEQNALTGTWEAYKKIEINKRKYKLKKKDFKYDADITLERAEPYVDWNKTIEKKVKHQWDDEQFEEWISSEYASSTEEIYEVNASNTKLTKEDVENLKKGDLTIIRNTIYARHGYSFKFRPLRKFFDAQSWYIPVHTDIRSDFTDIEKANIKLLLKYEKNASEYYDSFGRG